MIITCPHCQTKYQVTYEAIGSAGRKVQCAHCHRAWQQTPLDAFEEDPAGPESAAVSDVQEDALDEAMSAAEREAAAEAALRANEQHKKDVAAAKAEQDDAAGKLDPKVVRSRQKAFKRRQSQVAAEMPLGRLRRFTRVAAGLALVGLLAGAYLGRVQVVERFPDMAGVYASLGLGVNVVGLDFSNVTTLRSLRDGKDILAVSAQIVGLMPQPVNVPPVVVTLLDDHGKAIYEWSVTPAVRDLMAGERVTFDTQLTLPPGEAERVRLSFAGGSVNANSLLANSHANSAETHAAEPAESAPAHASPPAPEHH